MSLLGFLQSFYLEKIEDCDISPLEYHSCEFLTPQHLCPGHYYQCPRFCFLTITQDFTVCFGMFVSFTHPLRRIILKPNEKNMNPLILILVSFNSPLYYTQRFLSTQEVLLSLPSSLLSSRNWQTVNRKISLIRMNELNNVHIV